MTINGQPGNLPTDRPWALVETEKLPEVIRAQCDRYWRRLEETGTLALWRMSDRAYYGTDDKGGWAESAAVSFGGEEGELVIPRFNHYRSIGQAMLATATADQKDLQAQSVADDTASLIEAPIATGVIKAFWEQHGLRKLWKRDVERALLYGKGFHHLRWSIHDGEPVMEPEAPPVPGTMMPGAPPSPDAPPGTPKMVQKRDQRGVPLRQGDVVPASVSPICVIHEMDSQGDTLDWAMVAHREDAWELAARYPQFARELRDAIGRPRWPERVWSTSALDDVPEPGDTKITVWCVYHPKTSAVPDGLYAVVAADRVLYRGPALMDDEVPVYPIIPSLHLDTDQGHTALYDLLNIVELFDAGASNIATGHDAFGLKVILAPEGSNFDANSARGGLRVEKYDPGPNGEKPEAMDIEPVGEVAYRHQEWLEKQAETISGVNSTARGNPDSQVKSGSFAALMDSKTTHFLSAVHDAAVDHSKNISSGYLALLKAVGGLPRYAELAGRSGTRLKKVAPEDIEKIERVTVQEVDPAITEPGVRWELIQSMLKAGVITDAKPALEMMTTGKIEPVYRGPEAQLDLINGENDLLADGQLPPVVCVYQPKPNPMGPPLPPEAMEPKELTCHFTDDHAAHVLEHKALLDLPTRRNPALVKVIERHLADHQTAFDALADQPTMAVLSGQSVQPPPPQQQAAPGEPGSPGGPKPGPDGLKKPEGDGKAPRARPGGNPGGPNQPLMPQNPGTGERVQP